MNICLDGFALSLKQGTGLSTYSRELASTLTERGHNVSMLFGMDQLGYQKDLKWSKFVQRLLINGEAGGRDLKRYRSRAMLYGLPYAARFPLTAKLLDQADWVDSRELHEKLPAQTDIYNLPSVFRISQLYGSIFAKPLKFRTPKKAGIDIFHNTFTTPLQMSGVPNVVTLHDLIRLNLPFSTEDRIQFYRKRVQAAIKKADQIFVISEHSKNDLQQLLNVDDSKIHVTYQSVEIPQSVLDMDDQKLAHMLKKNFKLKPGGYFLYYGTIEPKKNVFRILEAAGIAGTSLPLVIAGKDGWLHHKETKQIKNMRKESKKHIKRFDYLPRKKLMCLLKGARALVFPSLYEGFGLPVLEAMTLGVPVITSNTTSLPEVGGDAPLYVDPYKVTSISEAMEKIAEDDELYEAARQKGLKQAAKYSTDRHYELLQEGYEKAIRLYNGK